jgi:hypothetical protein
MATEYEYDTRPDDSRYFKGLIVALFCIAVMALTLLKLKA